MNCHAPGVGLILLFGGEFERPTPPAPRGDGIVKTCRFFGVLRFAADADVATGARKGGASVVGSFVCRDRRNAASARRHSPCRAVVGRVGAPGASAGRRNRATRTPTPMSAANMQNTPTQRGRAHVSPERPEQCSGARGRPSSGAVDFAASCIALAGRPLRAPNAGLAKVRGACKHIPSGDGATGILGRLGQGAGLDGNRETSHVREIY